MILSRLILQFLVVMDDRYELPLFIVENGLGIDEKLDENNQIHDDQRMKYLKMHVEALKGAIEDVSKNYFQIQGTNGFVNVVDGINSVSRVEVVIYNEEDMIDLQEESNRLLL